MNVINLIVYFIVIDVGDGITNFIFVAPMKCDIVNSVTHIVIN